MWGRCTGWGFANRLGFRNRQLPDPVVIPRQTARQLGLAFSDPQRETARQLNSPPWNKQSDTWAFNPGDCPVQPPLTTRNGYGVGPRSNRSLGSSPALVRPRLPSRALQLEA